MKLSDLKERGMRSITIDNTEYFFVEDIKNDFPDLKIDTKEIIYEDKVPLIRSKYIHQKTEFDLMIEKTLDKDKNK